MGIPAGDSARPLREILSVMRHRNHGEEVAALAEAVLSFGAEVRQVRKARGLTLKQLAAASGISLSHLSAIERGTANASLGKIERIARSLDVAPAWFFARRPGAGPSERAFIVRARNRRDLNVLYGESPEDAGYVDALLSASIGGRFYMGLADYAPRSERVVDHLYRHDGEQHGLVLEGELELTLGGERIVLRAGDSYSFPGAIPHRTRNRSARPARLIWATAPVVIPRTAIAEEAEAAPERRRRRTGRAGSPG